MSKNNKEIKVDKYKFIKQKIKEIQVDIKQIKAYDKNEKAFHKFLYETLNYAFLSLNGKERYEMLLRYVMRLSN